jgi:hypothetical protein
MRTHGVSNFPDPSSDGQIPKRTSQQLGVTYSRLQGAQSACNGLLPHGQPTQAMQQRVLAQSVRFSQCVRTHGVANFPGPGSDGRIPDPASVGIDQSSPQFEAANEACRQYRPSSMPSNAAYNSWATHGS